jgi:peptide subunit release factor RF-3
MRKKRIKWSKEDLQILHECWKESKNRKQCLELVSKKLKHMPTPVAWSLIRKLSKTEKEWQITFNQKNKQKEEDKNLKEKSRQERVKRKVEKQNTQEMNERLELIKKKLLDSDLDKIINKVGQDFFFCSDVRQYVSVASCVYRVFSFSGQYGLVYSGVCNKCEKMFKYTSEIEEIIKK